MRKTALALVILTFLSVACVSGSDKYSVRDIGFVDVESSPYRILMVAKDPLAANFKLQEAHRRKEIEHTNVTLRVFAADSKEFTQEFPQLKLAPNLTEPLYWIVAPEKKTPISILEPGRSIPELLKSPLRETLFEKVMHGLCVVVLLESKDKAANESARARAENVILRINEVRHKFYKADGENIELVSLTDGERKQERWTLWALGEKEESADAPKIAVLYGKLRRAGPMFEGIDWDETNLFARIALLAQEWDGDARKLVAGAALPYVWTDWPGNHEIALRFNPVKEKDKIKAILDQPPVQAPKERKLKYEDWSDPPDPHIGHRIPQPDPQPAAPEFTPPRMSSTEVGVAFLVVGLLGWFALGLSVWRLEQTRPVPRQPA